ncbi:hypothetical protein EC957_006281 [Mortierella hygrophila]|uniref:Secreted protein n=1 Tax=Mortierella hygrophila TaxID=979708 RepID=A0A9P6K6B9_9FUNG|nr:hypothetical protein EC957_006281 [Mortierella hygrophila]
MFMKKALFIAALVAAPATVLAYEPVTCTTKNATQPIITSIDSASQFCTFMTGYGVAPVAPNEGCGAVYCYGKQTNGGLKMPDGYILSTNYLKNDTAQYVQVTGCINSAVWAQDPLDDGGQMDSHGWPYSCAGYNKFVSLLEPATNTFCIRCCMTTDNSDCNTSISTKGCWNVVPGAYTMADGSACTPPAGSNATATPTGPIITTGTATASIPGASVSSSVSVGAGASAGVGAGASASAGAGASATGSPTGSNTANKNAAGSIEASSATALFAGVAAALVAVAAAAI